MESELQQIDLKQEIKILKAIGDILSISQDPITDYKDKNLIAFDPANVCCIIALTDPAKRILSKFIDQDQYKKELPKLDYNPTGSEIKAKYSSEYLIKIFKLLCVMESVTIQVLNDYPASFYNKHFKVILAPRIESDD